MNDFVAIVFVLAMCVVSCLLFDADMGPRK